MRMEEAAVAADAFPVRTVGIDQLKLSDSIQPREAIDEVTVTSYASQTEDGVIFPPVVVFKDENRNCYWLADGFHRVEAVLRCGRREIEAEIHPGTKEDATLFACGANAKHGLPLKNADKRRVTERMLRARFHAWLADPEGKRLSDHDIARHIGVSQPFVSGMQKELFPESTAPRGNGHRNGASHDRQDVPVASAIGEAADAATDNGYCPATSAAMPATAQKAVASDIEPEPACTDGIKDASEIAQGLLAHVMGYFQAHREAGVEALVSAFNQAVPVIEARIRELETAGA